MILLEDEPTDDAWRAIVKAWAAWVNGEGPPVQGRNAGRAWATWEQSNGIRRGDFSLWRVKPARNLARMYCSKGRVYHVTKREDEPDPPMGLTEKWIGDWHEIPEG